MSETLATSRPPSASPARRTLLRGVVALTVLGAGIAVVRGLERALNAVFDKPPAPLSKPLPAVSRTLGTRYVADGPDEVLDAETVETLGTEDYLVRRYRDQTVASKVPGELINLNVNYYATGTSTPHVPEICWAGSGMEEAAVSRRLFTVAGLKRKDGQWKFSDITMKMISFIPSSGPTVSESGEPIYCNVAYVFQVNGVYVAGTQEVTSLFWKASYRYAYHSKIEITPMTMAPDGKAVILVCTQEDAEHIIQDFIRAALPAVEECLPDPAILTADTRREPKVSQ